MIDVEIKIKCEDHKHIEDTLKNIGARYEGIDYQTDVYFQTQNGRLKLRKGNIENSLIFYQRENTSEVRPSFFHLYKSSSPELLEKMLTLALGELIVVKKKRAIYYKDNVKFNLDEIEGLGKFVEIEAMTDDENEIVKLESIVNEYIKLFKLKEENYQSRSYSDLLLDIERRKIDNE